MHRLGSSDLERIFARLDRNGDGLVCLGELRWLLDRVGVHIGLDELGGIVGRESLDLQQFLFFYESISARCDDSKEDEDESDLLEAFKVFDLNNDGFISSEELHSVLSRLGLLEETSGVDCKKMISKFDVNSDGWLDFEEFKNMMLFTIP